MKGDRGDDACEGCMVSEERRELFIFAVPPPQAHLTRSASSCSLDMLPKEAGEGEKKREVKLVDLFKKKRMKGWWPVFSQEEGTRELAVSREGEKGAHSERRLGEGKGPGKT